MRIIGGTARSRQIRAPAGHATRPTSDRVREAMFSIIDARIEISGSSVLDLFAGSGALGLEALSRGATRATFIDDNPRAIKAIYENAERLELAQQCRVLKEDVSRALGKLDHDKVTFTLIFADPPYSVDIAHFAEKLGRTQLVHAAQLVVLEHARKSAPAPKCAIFELSDVKQYGDTAVSIYQRP